MKLNLTTKFFLNLLIAIGTVLITMVFLIQYSLAVVFWTASIPLKQNIFKHWPNPLKTLMEKREAGGFCMMTPGFLTAS